MSLLVNNIVYGKGRELTIDLYLYFTTITLVTCSAEIKVLE